MSALGKTLFLLLVLLLQGLAFLILWDGGTSRVGRIDEFASGETGLAELVTLKTPHAAVPEPVLIPLAFYDLVERDYPEDFSRYFDVPTTASLEASYRDARELGKAVYIREGCFHCHTQFVRDGTRDTDRWGAPTTASKASLREEGLPLWGLRRVGPDLANESGRRSNDWQAAHLYRPRSVLRSSIMPGYPWLFEEVEGRLRPNKEGLALMVYLQSLGAAPADAGSSS